MDENTKIVSPEPVKKNRFRDLGEFIRFACVVIVVVVVVRVFIAQPFIVSGSSMIPTFQNSNYLIVDELSYRFHEPKRGDVIVFHPPPDPSTYYIKRIIGIPGDTMHIKNGVVTLSNKEHPDGIILSEPYIAKDTLTEEETIPVPDGQYFVMGDNRPASFDSRRWGLLPRQNITGRAFIRLFPINEISILPGAYTVAP